MMHSLIICNLKGSAMAFYLQLAIGIFLVFSPNSIDGNASLKVPGLKVGDFIDVTTLAVGISRVTLSAYDSVGKSLHLEVRHNEDCKGKEPEVRINSKTNGKFDKADIIPVPDIGARTWINVLAGDDAYTIDFQDSYDLQHNFKYRPLHKLSDIKSISVYKGKECSENAFISVNLLFGHFFPEFSRIQSMKACVKGFPSTYGASISVWIIESLEKYNKDFVVSAIFVPGKNTVRITLPGWKNVNLQLQKSIEDETVICFHFEHTETTNTVTIHVGDEIKVHELPFVEYSGPAAAYVGRFKKIIEFETEE